MNRLTDLERNVMLTSKQVAQIAEVPITTVHEYIRLGYVTPSRPSQRGRDPNYFTFQDAALVRLIKLFSDVGIYRRIIQDAAIKRLHVVMGRTIQPDKVFCDLSTDVISIQIDVAMLTRQVANNLYRYNIL